MDPHEHQEEVNEQFRANGLTPPFPERPSNPVWATAIAAIAMVALIVALILGVRASQDAAIQAKKASDTALHVAILGKQSHQALCTFKTDLRTRYMTSLAFLAMTHEERVKTYGEALADIPTDYLRSQSKAQQSTLESLHQLRCP